MSKNQRHVVMHPDGWAVKAPGAQRASVVATTQHQAINAARAILNNSGGGELLIRNQQGAIRQKNTIPPGPDPFPPRG